MTAVLFFSCLAALLPAAVISQNDIIHKPHTSGLAVVHASIERLKETCMFKSDDNMLLKRLAYVASGNGAEPHTYTGNPSGGIWQVREELLTKSKKYARFVKLAKEKLEIDWKNVTMEDLDKPLYSAVAAGMVSINTQWAGRRGIQKLIGIKKLFPYNEEQQAELYNKMYEKAETDYTTKIQKLKKKCPVHELDLVFILDGSGSITDEIAGKMKDFVKEIVTSYDVRHDRVRIGIVSFAEQGTRNFGLADKKTKEETMAAIEQMTIKQGTLTSIYAGLKAATEVFKASKRTGVARVALLVSDGEPTMDRDQHQAEAERLKNETVELFFIGVGSYKSQLRAAEMEGMVSEPHCLHIRRIPDYNALVAVSRDLEEATCGVPPVIGEGGGTNNTYQCLQERTFRLKLNDGDSVLIRPHYGNVIVFGDFGLTIPDDALNTFRAEAWHMDPLVIWSRHHNATISITIRNAVPQEDAQDDGCMYQFIVYRKNVCNVGTNNLCLRNHEIVDCLWTIVVNGTTNGPAQPPEDGDDDPKPTPTNEPCPGDGCGLYPHQEPSKFMVCAESGLIYEMDCPQGTHYNDNDKKCSKSVMTTTDGDMCKVCTTSNWVFGRRVFDFVDDNKAYLQCLYIGVCEKKSCEGTKVFVKNSQKCEEPPAPPAPLKVKHCSENLVLDLLIIADASGSVYSEFDKEKAFVHQVVTEIKGSNKEVHIAVLRFSNDVWQDVCFDASSAEQVQQQIDQAMQPTEGDTDTQKALKQAHQVMLETTISNTTQCRSHPRRQAKKLVLLITDGRPNSGTEEAVIEKACDLKKFATIAAVGVGSAFLPSATNGAGGLNLLQQVVSDEKLVFTVDGFDHLSSLLDSLTEVTCQMVDAKN